MILMSAASCTTKPAGATRPIASVESSFIQRIWDATSGFGLKVRKTATLATLNTWVGDFPSQVGRMSLLVRMFDWRCMNFRISRPELEGHFPSQTRECRSLKLSKKARMRMSCTSSHESRTGIEEQCYVPFISSRLLCEAVLAPTKSIK